MTTKTRLFVVLLGVFCLSCAACSSSFVVNSEGDEGDADLSNKACATTNGDCTLRAAIQQANADGDGAFITFENVTTISPATSLPALTGGAITIQGDGLVTIDGGQADAVS